MRAILYFIRWAWNQLGTILRAFWWLITSAFNKVWAAALLAVGVLWTMWEHAGKLLGLIADKLDAAVLTPVSGKEPAGVRMYLEFLNVIFPVNETFTYMLGLLGLIVLVFFVKMLLRLIRR